MRATAHTRAHTRTLSCPHQHYLTVILHTNSACEKLASEGFVVFSLDHTPDATVARPYKKPLETTKFDFLPPAGSSAGETR